VFKAPSLNVSLANSSPRLAAMVQLALLFPSTEAAPSSLARLRPMPFLVFKPQVLLVV
jgi:hypothetical protein